MKKAVTPKVVEKGTVGATATINFPELNWFDVPARVDTGAATSSFHCSKVKLIEREGQALLSFVLDMKKEKAHVPIVVSDFKEIRVKNSFGNSEERYVIRTIVEIAGKRIRTQFSLADRDRMTFPVLLGRRLLKGRFVVDVSL